MQLTERLEDLDVLSELPQETPTIYGAIDALSCAETNIKTPWQTLNPYETMARVKEFNNKVLSPLCLEGDFSVQPGVHIQAGMLNPPSVMLDAASRSDVPVYSGDIAYLQPASEILDSVKKDRSVDSIGYSLMQKMFAEFPGLYTKSITTMVNGTVPINGTKILRACTEIIENGQIDDVLKHMKTLGDDVVLALEINSKYHTPEKYLELIKQLADEGKPVGISFDTAGMVTADAADPLSTDLGSIRRWYDKIMRTEGLTELLYCIEIDPISPSGERHSNFGHLEGQLDGMVQKWANSSFQHQTPHFVVETHPKQLDEFLKNPAFARKILRKL